MAQGVIYRSHNVTIMLPYMRIEAMPTADQIVRARIDAEIKEQATEVLQRLGITMSGAIRMLLSEIAANKALPLELRVPNAVTREAIEASRIGDVSSFASVDDLFADLEDGAR